MIFLGDVFTIEEKALSLSSKTMDVAINNSKRSDRFEEKQQLPNYVVHPTSPNVTIRQLRGEIFQEKSELCNYANYSGKFFLNYVIMLGEFFWTKNPITQLLSYTNNKTTHLSCLWCSLCRILRLFSGERSLHHLFPSSNRRQIRLR